ncbi:MAG: cadherin-like beta sandwich domain-containing protein, partial [Clostridia bacterium]|nr:cadherin-like beta sandwich domain-containing protein [Clostridia bacterium]
MKKVFGIFTSSLLILILLFSLFCFNVSAASASVRLSSATTIKVGDKITVTCVFDAGEKIVVTQHVLEYDNKLMKYVSSTDQGENGGASVSWANAADGNKTSYQATFEAIAEGKNYFKFLGLAVANEENPHQVSSNAGVIVTIEPKQNETPQKSTNANLSSLSVSGGSLSPKFAANTVTYNVTVPNSTSKVTISAAAQDQKAKVSGTGACDLKVGKNVKTVTVTAESGAKKNYTLNITRQEGS